MRGSVIVLCLVLSGLLMQGQANAQVFADSVADWQAAVADDGIVSQGEFNWEYGYISSFTGGGGVFYGWHRNSFYWESSSGIGIFWPVGQTPPDIVWGEGGDATGCRPPMSWADGGYPWAGSDTDKWAAVRRWTSNYTGMVAIHGTVGRYFDPDVVSGWDIVFTVAVNADELIDPVIYTKYLSWNDNTQYSYFIENVSISAGDTVNFILNAASWNANKSYMRMTATITEMPLEPIGDLNLNGCVNMLDFSLFALQWLQTGCTAHDWCGGSDFDHSGEVGLSDVAVFTRHWLECIYPIGDLNLDRYVNILDFSLFALQWLQTGCTAHNWCGGADLDQSGEVSLSDLAVLVSHWLECTDKNAPCNGGQVNV